MAYQGEALYRLQEIDLSLLANRKRLKAIAASLANDVAVRTAQEQVEAAEATLKPLQTKQRDLELQIQSTQNKRKTTEQRLYSGNVKNPKELQDMQQEIESLKRWHSELEDRLLEVMVEMDDAQTLLETNQAELESVLASRESENADLFAEKRELEAANEELSAQREALAGQIEAASLERYETMRPKKGNRPMARMSGENSCGACGVRLNETMAKQVRQQDDLLLCPSCQRMLVYQP